MSKYKYDLANELLQYFENRRSTSDERVWDAFMQFPKFTHPTLAWDFLMRADWLGTTLKEVSDRDELPTSIMDWAEFVKSRDGFTLIADCMTVGEATSKLQDLIYAMAHGEQL